MGDYDWIMSFMELNQTLSEVAEKFKAGTLGEEEGSDIVDTAVRKYYERWLKV